MEGKFDYILLLDVIEHLENPEDFMHKLYQIFEKHNSKVILSTPNVAHIFIRLMLLLGSFNYGRSGILDKTHTRLFTKKSLEKLINQTNLRIIKNSGIPIPLQLIFKNKFIANILIKINKLFIVFSKTLFSFQFIYVLEPKQSLETMLKNAEIKNRSYDE